MPIDIVNYKGHEYPKFQSEGFAAKFAFPFAKEVCVGYGVDVGCNRKDWAFVDKNGTPALMADPALENGFDALNLPVGHFDYIFSSHALEHMPNWVDVLDHWQTKLKSGGVLCLYLPHIDQQYWRPYNNRKHIHSFHPTLIEEYLQDRGWKNIFVSQRDLNHSFIAIAEN